MAVDGGEAGACSAGEAMVVGGFLACSWVVAIGGEAVVAGVVVLVAEVAAVSVVSAEAVAEAAARAADGDLLTVTYIPGFYTSRVIFT